MRGTEQEFAEHMVVSSKRSAFVTITICLLLTMGIAILAHTLGSARLQVPVVETPAIPVGDDAQSGWMPPMDWQALPTERVGLAEAGWPLDLSGSVTDWQLQEPEIGGRLLFANTLPEE